MVVSTAKNVDTIRMNNLLDIYSFQDARDYRDSISLVETKSLIRFIKSEMLMQDFMRNELDHAISPESLFCCPLDDLQTTDYAIMSYCRDTPLRIFAASVLFGDNRVRQKYILLRVPWWYERKHHYIIESIFFHAKAYHIFGISSLLSGSTLCGLSSVSVPPIIHKSTQDPASDLVLRELGMNGCKFDTEYEKWFLLRAGRRIYGFDVEMAYRAHTKMKWLYRWIFPIVEMALKVTVSDLVIIIIKFYIVNIPTRK